MILPTNTRELLENYWTEFSQYLELESRKLPISNNTHNTWYNFPLGTSLGTLEAVINTKGSNRVELRIHGTRSTETYQKLELMYRDSFAKELGNVIWDPMPNNILKRVYVEQDADIYQHENWAKQFTWLKENLEVFYVFFKPKLKKLNS
ncbi:MAG: DUF4268 domain-containing protein [Flavipsychrobacter sp.]|nr:DUF4268 domain-containing protein [Flavipsychrobacter sp.]